MSNNLKTNCYVDIYTSITRSLSRSDYSSLITVDQLPEKSLWLAFRYLQTFLKTHFLKSERLSLYPTKSHILNVYKLRKAFIANHWGLHFFLPTRIFLPVAHDWLVESNRSVISRGLPTMTSPLFQSSCIQKNEQW
jgi:hypothetical protein